MSETHWKVGVCPEASISLGIQKSLWVAGGAWDATLKQ